ncbi:hypothetical protein C8Q75DRAFT_157646 [Abortiporus biennis]|nr:hypothetical protein C8Q75DRAFT_157646 [Abortiporus biennis]
MTSVLDTSHIELAAMVDYNPRPHKRQRVGITSSPPSALTSSPLTAVTNSSSTKPLIGQPSSCSQEQELENNSQLRPLPTPVLLVSLPGLFALPPNHRNYVLSLQMSLVSFRKCLSLPALSPEIECRAWTGLAEVGMKIISGGLHEKADNDDDLRWARGIEVEVDAALSKGALLAQKYPSLREFRFHIGLLQSQFSQWQHKAKFARNQMRTLINSFKPTDRPYLLYSAYLALVSLYITPHTTSTSVKRNTTSSSTASKHSSLVTSNAQDIQSALQTVQDFDAAATKNGHSKISLLTHVLRLRILVSSNQWSDVPSAISAVENVLGLSYEPSPSASPRKQPSHTTNTSMTSGQDTPTTKPPAQQAIPGEDTNFVTFDDPFECTMVIHTLMMSTIYYTFMGKYSEASPRLSHLHALLDSGASELFTDGVVQVAIPEETPLLLQVTHPRVLRLLTFLVSSVAKVDVTGRNPRRKVFALNGIADWESEVKQELILPLWGGLDDIEEIEERLARIKADLLCEVISVSIMRSEFDAAEQHMNLLIAHTRTYDMFSLFASRISLLHAHFAHALGQETRALECYRVASFLEQEGTKGGNKSFVWVAAKAGEVGLRLGVEFRTSAIETGKDEKDGDGKKGKGKAKVKEKETSLKGKGKKRMFVDEEVEDNEDRDGEESNGFNEVKEMALEVARCCKGMGGILESIGMIFRACVSSEILKGRQHLKTALSLATASQDNYLRALVLALVSSHYMYTAGDHAGNVLQSCLTLAAGMGASSSKDKTKKNGDLKLGNLPLKLWVGERYLELYKRSRHEDLVRRQAILNAQVAEAVKALYERGASSLSNGIAAT